jgi:superfamily II DNA or RNA helicase
MTGDPTAGASVSHALRFEGRFRRYQTSMLGLAADNPTADRRYHLVAPPGSGKTIIGLELIGRFGRPAVIFAPTTTIQGQWMDKLAMFTPDPGAVGSRDPGRLGQVTALTYQVISTPDAATDALRDLAIAAWAEESAREMVTASDAAEAHERIRRMAEANPDAYRDELGKRVKRVRRDLLAADGATAYEYLHPNARALIDRIAAAGVGTVVLDECHHLLDYWAIVLRALVARLDRPYVIGLTATLPSLEDADEFENYTSLLGDVDFEIPTPAVIKEGDLAPFRDLAWWVTPTEPEAAYLRDVRRHFEEAVEATTTSAGFIGWLEELLGGPTADVAVEPPEATSEAPVSGTTAGPAAWSDWAVDNDGLARAAVAVAGLRGVPLAPGPAALLAGMGGAAPTFEDWLLLLERYGLERLKLSADQADHASLVALRRAIAPFGLTLTERGLRQGRSVVDLVLSFSEAKCRAAVDILDLEHAAIGDRLRAVIVTDFERLASGAERADGALERDAGSAFRAFRTIALDPRTENLNPVLVTGTTVRTTEAFAPELCERVTTTAHAGGLDLDLRIRHLDGIAEIDAEHASWRPGIYVALVSAVFELGRTKVLVGTRALLGEGWDAPSANTLIDLTSVTTATGVQQLRGRILRLDPAWPTKTAHAYDVVCLDQSLERGGIEFGRLVRRHDRTWGIVPPAGRHAGDIVRGLDHLDPALVRELLRRAQEEGAFTVVTAGLRRPREPWQRLDLEAANRRTAAAVPERDRVRALWRIGEPYDNAIDWFSRLSLVAVDFRTVGTIGNTLRALLIRLAAVIAIGLGFGLVWGRATGSAEGLALAVAAGLLLAGALNARSIVRLVRALLLDQPPDAIVGDAARAVLGALRRTNLVSGRLTNEAIAVETLPDGTMTVSIRDRSAGEDSQVFAHALDELFGPVLSPRYLIRRDDGRMPSLGLQLVWLPLRRFLRPGGAERPVYYPVPGVLGVNRERAGIFADEWRRWVGGGQLVQARSTEGRTVLAHARVDRRREADTLATERWR